MKSIKFVSDKRQKNIIDDEMHYKRANKNDVRYYYFYFKVFYSFFLRDGSVIKITDCLLEVPKP